MRRLVLLVSLSMTVFIMLITHAHYVMFARCVPIGNDFAGPVVYVMKNAVYMRNILVLSLKSHHMFVILVNLRPTAH